MRNSCKLKDSDSEMICIDGDKGMACQVLGSDKNLTVEIVRSHFFRLLCQQLSLANISPTQNVSLTFEFLNTLLLTARARSIPNVFDE